MNELLADLGVASWMDSQRMILIVQVALVLLIGFLVAKLGSSTAAKVVGKRLGRQDSMVARRFTFYILFGIPVAMALHQLGFKISVLLGAAGLLTVAVGFASQTSASNLISGLFLIAERSFVVGDVITVDGATGEVLSIDLLSVKLRTFDNLFVRVPNEAIIKARVTNLTHFPLRRLDVKVGVAYKEDLEKVRDTLMQIADKNHICLDEPEPLFIFQGFGDSALEMQFSVWCLRENYLILRNQIYLEIKAGFDREGIEIPFPHRSLYTGSDTKPFPVKVVDGNP